MSKKAISLAIKLTVFFLSLIGIILSLLAPIGSLVKCKYAIFYFTIQSNIWISLAFVISAILLIIELTVCTTYKSRIVYIFKQCATVSITITGIVYCFILAPFLRQGVWSIESVLTHAVVPILAVFDYFFYDSTIIKLKKIECFYALILPSIYTAFTTIGYFANLNFGDGINYPYYFLNFGSPAGALGFSSKPPYIGVVYMIILLASLVVILSLLYIIISGKIFHKTKGEK